MKTVLEEKPSGSVDIRFSRNSVRFRMTVASAPTAPLKGAPFDDKLVNMKEIISDANNNDAAMNDDKGVSDKDLDRYMSHYNEWKQSVPGKWMQTQVERILGLKFDNEIKWKNVAMIGGLHFVTIALFFVYVWDSSIVTWVWGKYHHYSHLPEVNLYSYIE